MDLPYPTSPNRRTYPYRTVTDTKPPTLAYVHAFRATESDDDEDTLHTNIMARLVSEKAKNRKKEGRVQFEKDKLDLYISD